MLSFRLFLEENAQKCEIFGLMLFIYILKEGYHFEVTKGNIGFQACASPPDAIF
jgi:hypothetical protein